MNFKRPIVVAAVLGAITAVSVPLAISMSDTPAETRNAGSTEHGGQPWPQGGSVRPSATWTTSSGAADGSTPAEAPVEEPADHSPGESGDADESIPTAPPARVEPADGRSGRPSVAPECGTGPFHAEAVLVDGTWTTGNGDRTVYTGPDMLAAMYAASGSLTKGRTTKELHQVATWLVEHRRDL
ncbi:hypothetical protein LZG04_12155 [Saccharothrix sp. S26]|uniref:hypothetical protein n=1 Tax=Saccharothrix sp. S26 TaxID=2907215 RepID=UPI001F3E9405|nr:hypothetical protein [Saccharothrix sp. S26]MCE6995548.1 hypothetical protein [Saccharothrix sp. S26]